MGRIGGRATPGRARSTAAAALLATATWAACAGWAGAAPADGRAAVPAAPAPAAAGGEEDGPLSHDPTLFRVDVDLLRIRPDRARSFGARLCGMRGGGDGDAYAERRFACTF